MSDIKFYCSFCKKQLSAAEDMEGKTIICPSCQNLLTIPIRIVIPDDPPPQESVGADSDLRCPYCRATLYDTDDVKTCVSCNTPHHIECWAENKGCTVFGCPEAPGEEDKISVRPAVSTRSAGSHAQAYAPPPHKTNAPGATASVVWAILGFFFFGLIFGIVAVCNANKAKKLIQEKPDVYTGGGLATTGLVIGIIDIVAWGLLLFGNLS